MKKNLVIAATLALASFGPALLAQTPTTTAPTAAPTTNQRRNEQQQRIGNGVANGSMTAGETARVERQEAGLNKEIKGMRQENNGKLTPADRRVIHRQQNHLSREIYRDKHNAAVQPPANGPINDRKNNQQQRVAQGIKSGSLTAGEASKLERREAGLNREERGMRQANGGKLTSGDRAVINHQQNQLSRQIYRNKHNAKAR